MATGVGQRWSSRIGWLIILCLVATGLGWAAAPNDLHRFGGYTGLPRTNPPANAQQYLDARGNIVGGSPAVPRRSQADEFRGRYQAAQRPPAPAQAPSGSNPDPNPDPEINSSRRLQTPDPWVVAGGGLVGMLIGTAAIIWAILWLLVPFIMFAQLNNLRAIRHDIQMMRFPPQPTRPRPTPPPVAAAIVPVSCPVCRHGFDAAVGTKVSCPRCSQHVQVGEPSDDPA